MDSRYPSRIICLTEEPTEVLYALGMEERIVGISGFTVRPARARREKPRVSAFTSAKVDRILELKPDFVVGFSDIQADIAQALIKSGIEVWISNHRSVDGILGYVRRLGALVGAATQAERYASELEAHVERVRQAAALLPRRARVYFEEWDEPLITGIRWVSELIGIAGGDDVFPERALLRLGQGSHPGRCRRGGTPRPGCHFGILVRQALPPESSGGPRRLGGGAGGARWRIARNQIAAHSAAGPGGAHRWARCHPPRIAAVVDAAMSGAEPTALRAPQSRPVSMSAGWMRRDCASAAAAPLRKSPNGRQRAKRGGVKFCASWRCGPRIHNLSILPPGFSLLEESIDAFALILAVEQIDEPLALQAQRRGARRALARQMHQTLRIGDGART